MGILTYLSNAVSDAADMSSSLRTDDVEVQLTSCSVTQTCFIVVDMFFVYLQF